MWKNKFFQGSDLFMAVGLVGILTVMVIPVPRFLIDILLSLSISFALVLLLTSVYVKRALDFSVFPSLLLITTLFRLSVNIATTRVILLHGAEEGTSAAGDVIRSFGDFVVGGDYAVGMVVFIILVIINFIVITKGANRVAEVAARFTLDAMPGKQMAIDADLNAGVINEKEARKRRGEISREADFYGAMDGASKFVRGDAIAGLLIVFVNILGGILIGTLRKGLSFADAAQVFTLLTIGDGLVSQIPALIISTAAGMIVTRTASGQNLGSEFTKQILGDWRAVFAASGIMAFLGIFSGLPVAPFLVLSILMGGVGYHIYRKSIEEKKIKKQKIQKEKLEKRGAEIENLLGVDLLELEVGYGLIQLVDESQNGELLERISNIRKQFALELGLVIPPVRIRDNLELKPGEYRVLLKGTSIAEGGLMIGHLLAIDPGDVTKRISGIQTKEPAFGLNALWIIAEQKEQALTSGYTVVDLSTVIATHLTEVIRKHAQELLGRGELQVLLDHVRETSSKLVDELIPSVVPVSVVLRVLKNLLKENISIRDLRTILETLLEHGPKIKDPEDLTERVRTALARQITKNLVDDDGEIKVLTLEKSIEEQVAQSLIQTDQGIQLSIDPTLIQSLVSQLNEKSMQLSDIAGQPVLLVSPVIRRHVRSLLEKFLPDFIVISHSELTSEVQIHSLETVRVS